MKRFSSLLCSFTVFTGMLAGSLSGHAQSILLSAGDFTLLGGTEIESSGVAGTVISNGNVGLSPGPTGGITGFPPAEIENGAIIPTGPVTAQARLDLIRAQVGLAGMPSDANLSTVDLGGLTLAPGVYTFNSAATLTGDLVLDGQGRNNVFWVFQIGTSLTTAINSTVTIINPGSNGGSDYGIFWNCGSAINIAGNNQIAGNYLAGTSITFGGGSARGGRALALAAITLDNNQIDALGGPGGGDWSGGLTYDSTGAVVPVTTTIIAPDAQGSLFFRHFGKRHRTTPTANRVVKGNASAAATVIQWRINGYKWRRTAAVRANGRWVINAGSFRPGKNSLRLRAFDAAGNATAVKRLTIWRH